MSNPYLAHHQSISSKLPGQSIPWLTQQRTEAFTCFKQGFPTSQDEDWRYTRLSQFEKKLFLPRPIHTTDATELDWHWLKSFFLEDSSTAVLVNGRFCPELSDLDKLPDTVEVLSLSQALQQYPERVKPYLSHAVKPAENGFVALNCAWFTDGLWVYIPEKLVMEKPLQILHIVQTECLALPRQIIVVGPMANAQLVERFVGYADTAYLTAAVNEFFIADNAELTWYKIQQEAGNAYHFGGNYIKQAADSRFYHHNFALGGLLARTDLHTELGSNSYCNLNGLYLGDKRQQIDNHTRINHIQPGATSREFYKGVLDQRAKGIFQGRVLVAKNAQKTDSQMNNRNLLLSNQAEADSKPQLEIYADDVKCAHGVTVGQLDEASIFYLQSRGLDKDTTKNVLTFAFANEMVDKVKLESLKNQLLQALLKKFPLQNFV